MDAQASADTPCFQTGETRYGKPIIERVITASTPIAEAAKCVLVSFDATNIVGRNFGVHGSTHPAGRQDDEQSIVVYPTCTQLRV